MWVLKRLMESLSGLSSVLGVNLTPLGLFCSTVLFSVAWVSCLQGIFLKVINKMLWLCLSCHSSLIDLLFMMHSSVSKDKVKEILILAAMSKRLAEK